MTHILQATMKKKKKKKKNLNIDNCLECFCLKVMRPTRSNQDRGKKKERVTDEGVGFITLPCLRSYTEIDGGT